MHARARVPARLLIACTLTVGSLTACGGPDTNGSSAVIAPPPPSETERPRAGSGERTDDLPEPQAPTEDGDW